MEFYLDDTVYVESYYDEHFTLSTVKIVEQIKLFFIHPSFAKDPVEHARKLLMSMMLPSQFHQPTFK